MKKSLLVRSFRRWWNSDPSTHGAALAYYAIFSLAPLFIIFVVALGGVFGRQAVEGRLISVLQSVVGSDVSKLIQTLVAYASEPVQSLIATLLSAVVTIIGSLALFSQVERALAALWHENEDAAVSGTFFKTKVIAVAMIVVLGLLIILSFIATTITAFLTSRASHNFRIITDIINIVSIIVSYGYVAILFMFMYKFLPGKPVSWKAASLGAFVGGILFIIGRYLLALYITGSVIFSAYGAVGAIILVLVWFYYSAQIFFFGGAVCYAIDETHNLRQTSL